MLAKNSLIPDSADKLNTHQQYIFLAIATLLCLGVTIAAYFFARSWEQDHLESELERRVNIHAAVLQKTIDRHVELLESMASLFAASDYVERDEFHRFVRPFLLNHPEVRAYEWIPRISQRERSAFETAARQEGLPGFQITELDAMGNLIPARDRAEYFPAFYLEPLSGNEQALGYDVASEDTRRIALQTARDKGTAITSGWIRLVQEADNQYGILIARPIYQQGTPLNNPQLRRDNLIGYILGVFRISDMVEEGLKQVDTAGLDFWVYEGIKPELATISYFHPSHSRTDADSAPRFQVPVRHSGFHWHTTLSLPEQQWSLLYSPAPAFFEANNQHAATIILLTGLLLTALLASYLISLLRHSQRAALLASRLTQSNIELKQGMIDRSQAEEALAESENKYRILVENAPEPIITLDVQSEQIIEANQQAEALFGLSRDSLLSSGTMELSPEFQPDGRASDEAVRAYIQQAEEGELPEFEWTIKNAAGQLIPCEIRLARLPDPQRILLRGTIIDISARKRAEGLQERLGRILENSSNEIYIFNADSLKFVQVNKGARDNLGYSMQELAKLTPPDIKPQFTKQAFQKLLEPLYSGQQNMLTFTTEHQRKDGSLYPVEVVLQLSRQESPQVFVTTIRDISERIKAEQALRDSEQYNRMLFEESTIGLVLCRMNGDLVDANPAFTAILGRTIQETQKLNYWDITPEKYAAMEQQQLKSLEQTGQYGPYEKEYIHKDGHLVPVRLTGRILEKQEERFIWSSVENISEHKRARARIEHMAFHDTLTDLPNRELLRDRVEHAINIARRDHTSLGILFLDIDRFKAINDSLGHDVGDQLLHQTAHRLNTVVREIDTVARFGGDEFIVVMEKVANKADIEVLARKITEHMEEPFYIDSRELFVTTSIGISVFPENSLEFEELISQADIAMYQAKESGRNNFKFYTLDMAERVIHRTGIERDLRRAHERKELFFHYQPIVDTHNERISSVEMLMRWKHPERGLVSPDEFIPVMEESGMISSVTCWALEQACIFCNEILEKTQTKISVAINFSAPCFYQEGITDYVKKVIHKTGADPRQLIFEITESTLFQDQQNIQQVMMELKAIGIRIALDDFGTGQSSLSHLRNFPIDIVKIDRSFIRDTPGDYSDCELVTAIIAMSHNLNKLVVAEGVETKAQLDFLRNRDCDKIQGYLFSQPLSGPDLLTRLSEELVDLKSGTGRLA